MSCIGPGPARRLRSVTAVAVVWASAVVAISVTASAPPRIIRFFLMAVSFPHRDGGCRAVHVVSKLPATSGSSREAGGKRAPETKFQRAVRPPACRRGARAAHDSCLHHRHLVSEPYQSPELPPCP